MATHIHPLISYLASGAIHLSAAGFVWVGLGWDGYTPPTFDVRWGEMDASISSAWAPEARAPQDDGPLVSVLGEEQAAAPRDVELQAPAAIHVLRSNERHEHDIETPTPIPHREPVVDRQRIVDEQVLALSIPERLSEPVLERARTILSALPKPFAQPSPKPMLVAEAPPTPEALDRSTFQADSQPMDPAPMPSAPVVVAKAPRTILSEPPLPDELPERPRPVDKLANPAVAEGTRAVTTITTGNSQPSVAPGALSGVETSATRKGNANATAERGQNSNASKASAASELPPGASPDRMPQKPANAAPTYPPEAYQQGQEGVVLLDVTISAEGQVSRLKLHRSCGFKLLDDAAQSAVTKWRFEPAQYRGRAIAYRVVVPVRFSIVDR